MNHLSLTAGTKINTLEEELQQEILRHLALHSPSETARTYCQPLGWEEVNLYNILLRIRKKMKGKHGIPKVDPLDDKARDLVERFRKGEIGFDEVHTEIGARALEQVLSGDGNIKMNDFLRATTVKMKKDQSEKTKDAMEEFIDTLFSGFVASPVCPHCRESTLISKEEYARQYRRKPN